MEAASSVGDRVVPFINTGKTKVEKGGKQEEEKNKRERTTGKQRREKDKLKKWDKARQEVKSMKIPK